MFATTSFYLLVRSANEDTAYKNMLGETWAEVCGENYGFRMVTTKNVAEVLQQL